MSRQERAADYTRYKYAGTMLSALKRHPKFTKYTLQLALIIAIGLFLLLELLSRGAAEIFNHAMENQDMLKGKITAKKVVASLGGKVWFDDLEWRNDDNELVLYIPSGSFRVNPLDIVFKNLDAGTIKELTINNAQIALHLSDDMKLDVVKQADRPQDRREITPEEIIMRTKQLRETLSESELKELGAKIRAKNRARLQTKWQNLNLSGKDIDADISFNNCQVEIFYRNRYYVLNRVNFHMQADVDKMLKLEASTGSFGGTMIGHGVNLRGSIDLARTPEPVCDLTIRLFDVDPSSMGFGLNIHDHLTLSAHFTGAVSSPTGDGILSMKELHLPGLDFTNVDGLIYYRNSELLFRQVTAGIYGGTLVARGDYNLDTRYYNIYGHGENLATTKALAKSKLDTKVTLDLAMHSDGNPRKTEINGIFSAGEGAYSMLPFKSLGGRFKSTYRDLKFYDVGISFAGFSVATDAFSIKNGKLTMSPIRISDVKGNSIGSIER